MPPAAVREFVKRIGVAKANSVVDVGMLEFCIRELLNKTAQRGAFSTVCADNEAGGVLAAQYLLRLGHRKIGHLTGPRHHGNMTERAKGFVARLAAARKPVRPTESTWRTWAAGTFPKRGPSHQARLRPIPLPTFRRRPAKRRKPFVRGWSSIATRQAAACVMA